MDKFNNMQVFCRIVELGTFTAVAKELKCSSMMVSKYMAQLESSLGVVLLNRTTRTLSLTGAGEAYYNRSRQLLEDLADLEALTAQLGETVKGHIKISAPIDFGGMYMTPVIEQFLARYPEIKILMTLDNKPPNLRIGSFDISLLVTDSLDPGVVARKIAETELCTYASPAYLAEHGCPEGIDELVKHRCLHYVDTPHGDVWLFNIDGEVKKSRPTGYCPPITAGCCVRRQPWGWASSVRPSCRRRLICKRANCRRYFGIIGILRWPYTPLICNGAITRPNSRPLLIFYYTISKGKLAWRTPKSGKVLWRIA